MNTYNNIYRNKIHTIDDIISLIKSDDFIITSLGAAEPKIILNNLHKTKKNGVKGCILNNCLPIGNYEFIRNPEYYDCISINSWFYSPPLRKNHMNGNISFLPQHGHLFYKDSVYAAGSKRKVVLCSCSPMDSHGFLSLSLSSFYEKDFIDDGAIVIAEVNPNLPRTFGDTTIHINQIDAIIETNYKISTLPEEELSQKDIKIGKNISELIEDGCTLQLGIGKIPNAVAHELNHKKNLGIHSEMITDTMVQLIKLGVIDNSKKSIHRGKSVCCFALGSKELYDFIDDNPSIIFKSASYANDPYLISQNYKMTSINTTLEVDLTGQCASESIGHTQYSGTGGQADTCFGASMSDGGKSIVALYSTGTTFDESGNKKTFSKISPLLKYGSAVSLSRNDVNYIVTEYGIAKLRGLSIKERVKELIRIAHPDFKDELEYEANKNMIW